MRESSKQRCIT